VAEPPYRAEQSDIPAAVAVEKSRRSVQLVWLIPLLAALIGGWLAIKSVLDRGPVITISFKTAEGLEAGKTKVKYKDVEVGHVTAVELSPDLKGVIVSAELGKNAGPHLVEDTRFWVARARVSAGNISGLGTLLGGAYIGVDLGKSQKESRHFVGLEVQPVFTTDMPGREFVLHAESIGSLDAGSPVFFRRLQVGQVTTSALDKDGNGVTLRVFVNAPYDQYVNANTRFWEASGFDVKLDASGIEINTQSLVSIAIGGIAFQTPAASEVLPPAEANAAFELFPTRAHAMKHPDAIVDTYLMVFNESLRGLTPGAPVDFRGIDLGEVVSVNTQYDPATASVSLPVEIHFFPERFTARSLTGLKTGRMADNPRETIDALIARGLRAQIRTGNLLTGQLYIALDFFPNAPKVKVDWTKNPAVLPTVAGSVEDLRVTVGEIVKKLDKIDFEGISSNLQQTLQSTAKLMQRLDGELAPEARLMMQDARKAIVAAERTMVAAERTIEANSPLQQDTREAMREIARAAKTIRTLADYLERHPEALIRGKTQDSRK
jgi:paraquat-inducible protein B